MVGNNFSKHKFIVPMLCVTAIKLRILVSASSQAPAWEFSVGSSSFPLHEAATAWMQEVEQRRSGCRELRQLGYQAGAWEPA